MQPRAQPQRDLEPVHDERLVDRLPGVPAQDARADERMRIDVGVADEAAPIGFHDGEITGLERRERRTIGIHFVAENPGMARGEASVLAALEAEPGGRVIGGDGVHEVIIPETGMYPAQIPLPQRVRAPTGVT